VSKTILVTLLILSVSQLQAQKVDSIYFHLYTDSLKKGQHNYINIDGKLSNGSWRPLTSADVDFSCPEAKFEKNDLFIPENFAGEKVKVKAILKSNPAVWKEITIYIKQMADPALPTKEEILKPGKNKRKN
jgi:hypothetical protein